jgi:hypothetical protein
MSCLRYRESEFGRFDIMPINLMSPCKYLKMGKIIDIWDYGILAFERLTCTSLFVTLCLLYNQFPSRVLILACRIKPIKI